MSERPQTLGELKRAGYRSLSVKEELRNNLFRKLRAGEELFPGIVGYEETVIPQVINALIAGHNMIFLGERGQAKSKMIRLMVNLLDEYIPAVKGCEIRDDPFAPVCSRCRELVKEYGDELEIVWIHRDQRYVEKLATPDVTVADLIGEVDPIRVAEGRYLSDERTIHFGLVPRSHRGVFAINELPDLPERVQVSLFNIMEEGDIQIRGYTVRLPLDILIVATANPEDYTNRGRIVTPLKDRFDAQIRTHYPLSREREIQIMEQEARLPHTEGLRIFVPSFMKEIIAEMTFVARRSPYVNHRSGVSVRMTIANYEAAVASAVARSLSLGEQVAVPRISDLAAVFATAAGKVELEYTSEEKSVEELLETFVLEAVKAIFNNHFSPDDFQPVVELLEGGAWIEVGDKMPSGEYMDVIQAVEGIAEKLSCLADIRVPGEVASVVEFVLEGLYSHGRIRKIPEGSRYTYRGRI